MLLEVCLKCRIFNEQGGKDLFPALYTVYSASDFALNDHQGPASYVPHNHSLLHWQAPLQSYLEPTEIDGRTRVELVYL
jgi:hypothetical protein